MTTIEYAPVCDHCGREKERHSLKGPCFFLLPKETLYLSEAPTSYEPGGSTKAGEGAEA